MTRPISTTLTADLLKAHSDEGLLRFLTVSWDDGVNVGTDRIVVHDTDQTRNGQTFTAGSFKVALPDEDDADIPTLKVAIQDIDRVVWSELEKLDSRYPATALVEYVRLSDLNSTAELTFTGPIRTYKLNATVLDAFVETFENVAREPLTPYRMSPAYGFNSLRSL